MSPTVSGVLILSALFLLTFFSIRFYRKSQFQSAIWMILILGAMLRLYSSSTPFLHQWDERYHALVAKNLIDHPLTPTLHEHPVLEYDNNNWVGSNIWLAKPSFPLWLMSGSIAVFGHHTWAVRLPSILLGLLAIWLTYLIAGRLFGSKTAVIAAYLHAIHGLTVELIGGGVSSDHVEHTFIVMVQLAILFAVLQRGMKLKYLFTALSGVFMGLAFLSKWYPALIVLPVALVIFNGNAQVSWKDLLRHGGVMMVSALVVALPWTIYMYQTYPNEMQGILTGTLSAYSETVPGHAKPWYYYLNKVMVLYGELIYIPIFFAIYRCWKVKKNRRMVLLGFLCWMGIPLLLFSFAETKRFTYLLIAAPAFFMLTAFFFVKLSYLPVSVNKYFKWMGKNVLLLALIVLPLRYLFERIKLFQEPRQPAAEFYDISQKELDKLNQKTIVFGTDDYIEMMFHTDVYAAYRKIPSQDKCESLEKEGFEVLIYDNYQFIKKPPIMD